MKLVRIQLTQMKPGFWDGFGSGFFFAVGLAGIILMVLVLIGGA